MVKTKELSEDIRSAIISKHKTSKGYKAISKDLGIPVSTVHNVIKKFAKYGTVKNLPARGGEEQKLKRDVFEGWCKWLKKKTTSNIQRPEGQPGTVGVMVSTSTIHRTLNQTGLHGRRPMKKRMLRKRHKKEQLNN